MLVGDKSPAFIKDQPLNSFLQRGRQRLLDQFAAAATPAARPLRLPVIGA